MTQRTLYEFDISGNCHKVRLMLSLLGLPCERVTFDRTQGEHKSASFRARNPFGQVPVLVEDDFALRDSQAILYYLARRYGGDAWLPADAAHAAAVIAWLSVAANEVTRGPTALRAHHKLGRAIDVRAAEQVTADLLALLESELAQREFLAGTRCTIADVALSPYLALAPEAHVDLEPFSAVRAWLGRIEQLPGFVSMPGMYLTPA